MKNKMQLINIGILVVFIGFILVFLGALKASKEANTSSNTKVAVGGFIGFIPFGFGNDKTLLWFVTILSAALFLFFLFFNLRR